MSFLCSLFYIHFLNSVAYFSLDGSEDKKELFLVLGTGKTETNFDNELNMTRYACRTLITADYIVLQHII